MPVNDTTANRGYQKPNIANTLADDVGRLRSALDSIDTDMASKAPTASPTFTGTAGIPAGSAANPSLYFTGDPNTGVFSPGADSIAFTEGGTEAMRIDSSSRVLIGTTSGQGNNLLQVQQTAGGFISLRRNEAATAITAGEDLGGIQFQDNQGNVYAQILGEASATAGSSDYPGQIVLSTTADGGSAPAAKFTIDSLDGNAIIENGFPTVRPSLDLPFALTKRLDPRITFTRSSDGTYTDATGVLRTAGTNIPRFDHNPTTGESLGLLVEEQRTNLVTRSEEFEDAAWTKLETTISANSVVAPNKITSADSLVESVSSAEHNTMQSFTAVSGTAYTFSVFVKSLSGNRGLVLRYTTTAWTGSINTQAGFDLTTGAGSIRTGSPTITSQAYPGGWWRFSMTATSTANGTPSATIHLVQSPNSSLSYTGDGTSGIYLWGAQLEAGAFPTSYIPTTTAAATRSADVASISGSNYSSWAGVSTGTIFANAMTADPSSVFPCAASINDTTSSNRIQIGRTNSSGAALRVFVISGGVTSVNGMLVGSTSANQLNRIAFAYAASDFGGAANGVLATPVTSGTVPVTTQLQIGNAVFGSPLNGCISRLTYWPARLPNSTLQAITQ